MSLTRLRAAFRAINSQQRPFIATRRTQFIRRPGTCAQPPVSRLHVLQSRFPTKTFITLLTLGGAAYYFLDWDDDFTDYVNPATLHFYNTIDDIKNRLNMKNDARLAAAAVLAEPTALLAGLSEEMTEEDSRRYNIPITHMFNLEANSPGVSHLFSFSPRYDHFT